MSDTKAHINDAAASQTPSESYAGGGNLQQNISTVEGRHYPRGATYEAEYFDSKPTPTFRQLARIGNPAPLALAGFASTLSIVSFALMQWGGEQYTDLASSVGTITFFGGLAMFVGGQWELVTGNSFAYVVFSSFGAFWLGFGAVFNGSFGVAQAYSAMGEAGPRANALSLGFWMITYCVLIAIYLIVSLRTNVVMIWIFANLEVCVVLLSVIYCRSTSMSVTALKHTTTASGVFGFLCTLGGWYLILVQMLADVGYPIKLPVGDMTPKLTARDAAAKQA